MLRALEGGGVILVVGWKASNHCKITRALKEAGVVRFVEKPPEKVDSRDFVFFTRFVRHAHTKMVGRSTDKMIAHCMGTGVIREHLKAIVQFANTAKTITTKSIVEPKHVEIVPHPELKGGQIVMSTVSTEGSKLQEPTEMSGGVTTPLVVTTVAPDPRLAFAVEFVKLVGHDPQGRLGRLGMFDTARLVRKHFGPGASARSLTDLLIPEKSEGKSKIGWYRASDVLLEFATSPAATNRPPNENSSSLERARWLVGRKPEIQKQIQDLRSQIESLTEELRKAEDAQDLLEKLDALLK